MEMNDLPPGAVSEVAQDLPPGAVGLANQPQNLTPLQSFYRTIRPYLAPAAEIGGSVVGGLVGGGAGSVVPGAGTFGGGLLGAGLGYGMARQLEKIGDVYLGGYQPEPVGEQALGAATDVAMGAALEAGGMLAGKAIGAGVGKLADVGSAARLRAADILRKSTGTREAEIINALKSLGMPSATAPTAAQATANIDAPAFQALLARAGARTPMSVQLSEAIANAQERQSLQNLASLSGGETATGARAAGEQAKSILTTQTTPMREAVFQQAPTLDGLPIAQEIMGMTGKSAHPELAGNDPAKRALAKIAEDIADYTDKGGRIDIKALEAIRKNSINSILDSVVSDPGVKKRLQAKLLSDTKPVIDDAIENVAPGWKNYLKTYSTGAKALDARSLTAEAQQLYKTNKASFIDLVTGESPEVVERFMGPGNYDIAKQLAQKEIDVLRKEAQQAMANQSVSKQAAAGQQALQELLQSNKMVRIPHIMSRGATVANAAIQELETRLGRKTMDLITEASMHPQKLRDLLMFVPAKERSTVLKILNDPASWGPAGASIAGGAATAATE